jgi:NTP pyrophosphatase (non-canonical NTP hydrolase)
LEDNSSRSPEQRAERSEALEALREALRRFVRERDWEQFQTPKNLCMALMVEAAELAEHFQWLRPEESAALDERTREAVREELADVFLYLIRLADTLDVDLVEAARAKMRRNAEKYPAERVRGSALKYTAYR